MTAAAWIAVSLLLCAVVALGGKVFLLRRGVRELREGLRERLSEETNTLLTLPTRDRELRLLAEALNRELRALRRERLRYQRGDRELREAVAGLSHDLRTPLTALGGYLELLEGESLSPDARRYAAQIGERSRAMKRLTEELLVYSAAASVPERKREPVELGRALEEALLTFCGAFESRGIVPALQLTDRRVERQLDSAALSRVLGNILSNALRHGAGTFAVTLEETGTMTFSNDAPDLDPVSVAKFFDRFYTVDSARPSTGLGLSIARLLTEQMGGTIAASCADGRLTVELAFPAAACAASCEICSK